jgi:uncharacterized protein
MPTHILKKQADTASAERKQARGDDGGRLLVLTAGLVTLRARLAYTATADRMWAALPLFGVAEPSGEVIHFEVPVTSGRDRTARLQARLGEVCF